MGYEAKLLSVGKELMKRFLAGKSRVYRILSSKKDQKQKLSKMGGIQSFLGVYFSFQVTKIQCKSQRGLP